MNKKLLLVFLAGFFSCAFIFYAVNFLSQSVPFVTGYANLNLTPSTKISEDNILLYNNEIILKISNATISNYDSTGSMKPIIDVGAHGIRIKPNNVKDIEIGDIISFRSGNKLIVHRVIEKGTDETGIYFITKGDGNFFSDGKVRFEDVEYITIGILW